jgi:hypothetical protein
MSFIDWCRCDTYCSLPVGKKSAEDSWDHHTHWLGPWIH